VPALLLLLLVLLLTAAAFVAGYRVATARARSLAPPPELAPPDHRLPPGSALVDGPATDVDSVQRDWAPSTVSAPEASNPEPTRVAFAPHAAEGTQEWHAAMAQLGGRMRRAGVKVVVFSHGSFVGDDPLALARLVEEAVPGLPGVARKLRELTRAHVSRLLGDLSNYTDEYVAAFARATGVDAVAFTWSGENHHAGRVQGAVRLARALALHGGGSLRWGDHVLLVGHSHGGQLFAILSQLVACAPGYEDLVAAAGARGEDVAALEEHLALLRRCSIDVATFGTPLRYGWARGGGRLRLLHVVNHRGAAQRAPSMGGLLHTRHGDYVHQLGAHGSDFPAPTARERGLNARLDRVLGKGRDVRGWLRHLAHGLRVSPQGRTVLVDYGDDAGTVPNFLATGLGHAAYTRRDAMLFHAQLLANHFYPEPPERPWVRRVRRLWVATPRSLPPRREPSTPEG
jgi:hypothetical protein